jgi:mono/diheme cytochrome c family protein
MSYFEHNGSRRAGQRKAFGFMGLGVVAFGLLATPAPAAEKLTAKAAEELFQRRLQPLFSEKCLACHGNDEQKLKGKFDMRTRAGLLKGGDSGNPAVLPGDAESSPLYVAVTRQNDDLAMPPKENDKLTSKEVEWVRDWIDAGAPWPDAERQKELTKNADKWAAEDGIPVATSGGLADEWTNRKYKVENLWAYQPLRKPAVPGGGHPIDAFIQAGLTKAGLAAAPLADRRTLIRRATFDLLGLPPTPAEVEAFIKDPQPDDQAFVAVIDRLLASPHYGEQWGRHWLDVVRYADSSGFANDFVRGNTWRYRDYVIRSFNADKPYDQFVREQLAGDEIAEVRRKSASVPDEGNNKTDATSVQDSELLVAAGFLRMGPWELTGMEVAKVARQRFLDDATDITGQVFLGHMLQCARCHDHKFDPIPTRDYYSFQAAFATTQMAERDAPFLKDENQTGFEERKYLEARRQAHLATLKRLDEKMLQSAAAWFKDKGIDPTKWNKAVEQAGNQERGNGAKKEFVGAFGGARNRMLQQGVPEDQFPPKLVGFTPDDYGNERVARKGLERLKWEADRYLPIAFTVYDGRTPEVKAMFTPARMPADRMTTGELEQVAILAGGDPFAPTIKVTPSTLSVVDKYTASQAGEFPKIQLPEGIEGRRQALAEWITHPKNPLTARVMANRVWQGHFGIAIAGNPNNFGATGKKPTHPELLDWLASTFVEKGWSVKTLHRMIMTSEAYRRSSQHPDTKSLGEKDPTGTSYAAFKPRRLTAEELRDSMLQISGELNAALGGIPARPEINLEAALQPRQVMGTLAEAWQPAPKPEQRNRRSIYALKIRGQRDPFMEVFNEPSPELSCEARDASTVTPQVFSLFNGQPTYDRALALAARLQQEKASRPEVIARAFHLAYGRRPTAAESQAALQHWDAMTARHRTLTFEPRKIPREVTREAVEENTGEKFKFSEKLAAYADFVPDLQPSEVSPEIRGLAEVCLVLFNANEFAYVY